MNKVLTFEAQLQTRDDITDTDLKLIHQFADESTQKDDFFVRKFIAINDRPLIKDGVRLVVSKEYQIAHSLTGKPLMADHSALRTQKLGRVFRTTITEEKDVTTTIAHVFIARGVGNDEAIRRIELGIDREVSISLRASTFDEITLSDGSTALKVLPSDSPTDGYTELSLVGIGAHPDAVAASADPIPLTEILKDKRLSEEDRQCLLFGRQMKSTLIDDIVTSEKQVKLISDMKLAVESYQHLSPFTLQDRHLALQKLMRRKSDTQVSLSFEELNKEIALERAVDATLQSPQDIINAIKENK